MEHDFRFYVSALSYQAEWLRSGGGGVSAPGWDIFGDLLVVTRRVAALSARCLDFYRARCARLAPGTSSWPVLADPPSKGNTEYLWESFLAQTSPAKTFLDRYGGLGSRGRVYTSRLAAYRRFGFSILGKQRFVEWGLIPEAGDSFDLQARHALFSAWMRLLPDPKDESKIL